MIFNSLDKGEYDRLYVVVKNSKAERRPKVNI